MKASMVSLATITTNNNNPRRIGDEAFDRLCESVKRDPQFMALRPIVIDEDRIIIGGNQRYRACKHVGMTEVPENWVVIATGLTPEQRKRFILVDNAPEGMAGEWDFSVLTTQWELPELQELGFERLLIDAEPPSSNKEIDEGEMEETTRECPKCGFKW